MQKSALHKIISIITVLLLLLPIGMQLFHTLENHKHKICDVKNISHFHTQKIDCSVYHQPLETTATLTNTNSFNHTFTFYKTPIIQVNKSLETTTFHTSSRAPPFFIV